MVYEDNWPIRGEPRGVDPYNTLDEYRRQQAEMIEAMERAWKACIQTKPFEPEQYILVGTATYDLYWDYVYKADLPWYRGHEFLPYG